jgi:hypothetical protein
MPVTEFYCHRSSYLLVPGGNPANISKPLFTGFQTLTLAHQHKPTLSPTCTAASCFTGNPVTTCQRVV